MKTPREAIEFVRSRGMVRETALAEAIVGGPISGSWWGHSEGHRIFALTRAVRDCSDVLVCRLLEGKITFVHRRLWPALVRLSKSLPADRLAAIREEHTASGKHRTVVVAYPKWVPADVRLMLPGTSSGTPPPPRAPRRSSTSARSRRGSGK